MASSIPSSSSPRPTTVSQSALSSVMDMSSSPSPTSLLTSPSATETASQGNQNQGSQSGTPSSLYLFTFLTTLLLLLTVSFGIVLRSFVLRRRFRRRVEAAIAAGVLLPGSLNNGGRDRRLQEKPKLWEVWMDEEKAPKDAESAAWGDIMPISAQIITRSSSPPASPPLPQLRNRGLLSYLLYSLPFQAHPHPRFQPPTTPLPTTTPTPAPHTLPPAEPAPSGPENIQVTVLIAMPSASRAGSDDDSSASAGDLKGKGRATAAFDEEDEELPEVCFGTTEVVVRDMSALGFGRPGANQPAEGEGR